MSARFLVPASAATCIAAAGTAARRQAETTAAAVRWGASTQRYSLWDVSPVPRYPTCATACEAQNPRIVVKPQRTDRRADRNCLKSGMAANPVPEVCTGDWGHASGIAASSAILCIPSLLRRDKAQLDADEAGLVDRRTPGRKGNLSAVPKDWDAGAIFCNLNANPFLNEAGAKGRAFHEPADGQHARSTQIMCVALDAASTGQGFPQSALECADRKIDELMER